MASLITYRGLVGRGRNAGEALKHTAEVMDTVIAQALRDLGDVQLAIPDQPLASAIFREIQ